MRTRPSPSSVTCTRRRATSPNSVSAANVGWLKPATYSMRSGSTTSPRAHVVVAGGVEVLLRHAERRLGFRVVQRRPGPPAATAASDRAGEGVDHLTTLARGAGPPARACGPFFQPGDHLRDGERAVVRRAEHDQPAARCRCRPRSTSWPSGRHALMNVRATRPPIEWATRCTGASGRRTSARAARAARRRRASRSLRQSYQNARTVQFGGEAEQQLAVIALQDAGGADGHAGVGFGDDRPAASGEVFEAAVDNAEDAQPDQIWRLARWRSHRQLPAHDPVQDDDVAGDRRRRPAHVAGQRALLHARVAALAEVSARQARPLPRGSAARSAARTRRRQPPPLGRCTRARRTVCQPR